MNLENQKNDSKKEYKISISKFNQRVKRFFSTTESLTYSKLIRSVTGHLKAFSTENFRNLDDYLDLKNNIPTQKINLQLVHNDLCSYKKVSSTKKPFSNEVNKTNAGNNYLFPSNDNKLSLTETPPAPIKPSVGKKCLNRCVGSLKRSSKDNTTFKPLNTKVPSSVFYCHCDNGLSAPDLKQTRWNQVPYSEPFSPNYKSERKVAYVQMSRATDDSSVVLEEDLCDDSSSAIPGWDLDDHEPSCLHVRSTKSHHLNNTHSKESLLFLSNYDDLYIKNFNLNYADIDFISTSKSLQPGSIFHDTSSKVKYAQIDFNKTTAVSKTGKDLMKERQTTAVNKFKTVTSSITKNANSTVFPNYKKASSSFYVSVPLEYFDCVTLTNRNSPGSASMNPPSKLVTKSNYSQRKLSLDILDSPTSDTIKHSNTLPHTKSKAN